MLTKKDLDDRIQKKYKDFINLENVFYYIEMSKNGKKATVVITTTIDKGKTITQRAYFETHRNPSGEEYWYLARDWND